jgi:hypothetical protein
MIISEHLIEDVTTTENTDQKNLVEPGNTIKRKRQHCPDRVMMFSASFNFSHTVGTGPISNRQIDKSKRQNRYI